MNRWFILKDLKMLFKDIPRLGLIRAFKYYIWATGYHSKEWWSRYYTPETIKFWKIVLTVILAIILLRFLKRLILGIIYVITHYKQIFYSYSYMQLIKILLSMLYTGITSYTIISKAERTKYKYYLQRVHDIYTKPKKISLDPLKILDNKQYVFYLRTLKHHVIYKKSYLKGVLLWMTSNFWIVGVLTTLFNPTTDIMDIILANFFGGACVLIYFTKGLLVTPAIFIGVAIYPTFLKMRLFHGKYLPFSEQLLVDLKYKQNEKLNAMSVFAGSFFDKFCNSY